MNEREKKFMENYSLVGYVVNTFFPKNLYKDDLKQEGYIGLLKAIDTYDESKNIKFSTYAVKCIKNKIIDFLRVDKIVKIPVEQLEKGYSDVMIPIQYTEGREGKADLENYIADEDTKNMADKMAVRIDDVQKVEKMKQVILDYVSNIENTSQKDIMKSYIVNRLSVGKRRTPELSKVYDKSSKRVDAIIAYH